MFKNMKITSRVVAGFAAVFLLAAIAAAFALFSMEAIADNTQELYKQSYKQNDSVGQVLINLSTEKLSLYKRVLSEDEQESQAQVDAITGATQSIDYSLAVLKQSFQEAKRADYVERITLIEKDFSDANISMGKIKRATTEGNKAEAINLIKTEFEPRFAKVESAMKEIHEQANSSAKGFVGDADRLKSVTFQLIIAILGAGFVIAVIITFAISRSIRKPMKEILAATKKVAQGELNAQIGYSSKNELGQLSDGIRTITATVNKTIGNISKTLSQMAQGDMTVSVDEDYSGDFDRIKNSMNDIVDSLNDILSQINQSSNAVSSSADQVSSGALALSDGASEQASSLEELSATIEDVSQQVKRNAQNAENAKKTAADSAIKTANANDQMVQMMLAMQRIDETSIKISKIIKTIDEIAFQTNILALNAAVEAARAGGAGKGFAVVAEEVRNLANKSAEAAKNTSELIEDSIGAVQHGTQIAETTADALKAIAIDAKNIAEMIKLISEASSMQTQALVQITQGIAQITHVVQSNSATAEESAAASEELSSQAHLLKDLVGKFQLRTQTVYLPDARD